MSQHGALPMALCVDGAEIPYRVGCDSYSYEMICPAIYTGFGNTFEEAIEQ